MNKEEAIICLQGLLENPLINKGSYLAQAIEMAIQALSQEPCEDAIDRAEAMTEIMMSKSITAFDRDLWIRTKDAVHILRELPSVTQKSGKWKQILPAGVYECNICGQNVMTQDIVAYKHCHGCGAKMESEG